MKGIGIIFETEFLIARFNYLKPSRLSRSRGQPSCSTCTTPTDGGGTRDAALPQIQVDEEGVPPFAHGVVAQYLAQGALPHIRRTHQSDARAVAAPAAPAATRGGGSLPSLLRVRFARGGGDKRGWGVLGGRRSMDRAQVFSS